MRICRAKRVNAVVREIYHHGRLWGRGRVVVSALDFRSGRWFDAQSLPSSGRVGLLGLCATLPDGKCGRPK